MRKPAPLVIAIGNSLRSDDGAGIAVAKAISSASTSRPDVILRQQLSPDMAAEISMASAVLFIDSFIPMQSWTVSILQPVKSYALEGPPATDPFSHALTPERLLALTLALYNHCPPAWQLLIPGHQWDVGDELSPATRQACQEALPLALEWVAAHA